MSSANGKAKADYFILDAAAKLPGRVPLPTAEQMRCADLATIASGITGLELMERAGQACFQIISSLITPKSRPKILIFAGSGNNGGDGLVIARLFHKAKLPVLVVLPAGAELSRSCQHNLELFQAIQGKAFCYATHTSPNSHQTGELPLVSAEELQMLIGQSHLFIDALLGNGQNRPPGGHIADLLSLIARERSPESLNVAIDLPTGINADTGQVYEHFFQADITLALQWPRIGLLQHPARSAAGEIYVVDLGISAKSEIPTSFYHAGQLPTLRRSVAFHKGQAGHVCVIGGSRFMPGAAALAASAALSCGTGLVTAVFPAAADTSHLPAEVMRFFPANSGDFFTPDDLPEILSFLKGKEHTLVIGPGLGASEKTRAFVLGLLREINNVCIIDADALNALAPLTNESLKLLRSNHVITPHPGEMARLLGIESASIQANRINSALRLSSMTPAIVVLKGAGSIIAHQQTASLNSTGTPYMATAGSGDVLTGVIAALSAQGLELEAAASAAVYLHGLAGELQHSQVRAPLLASELIAGLRQLLAQEVFN